MVALSDNFNSTFVLSMATLIVSAMGVCCAYGLRSKCTSVNLCFGAIKVIRDVEAELHEDEILINSGISPNINQSQSLSDATSEANVIRKRMHESISNSYLNKMDDNIV